MTRTEPRDAAAEAVAALLAALAGHECPACPCLEMADGEHAADCEIGEAIARVVAVFVDEEDE